MSSQKIASSTAASGPNDCEDRIATKNVALDSRGSREYPSFGGTPHVQRTMVGSSSVQPRGTRWIVGPGGTEWMDSHRRKAMRFVGTSPASVPFLCLAIGG